MRTSLGRRLWVAAAAGLLALGTETSAAASLEKGLRKIVVEDACAGAALGLKAGERFEWRHFEAEDLQGRSFLVLKAGGRRVLLELRRGEDDVWEVVERRAWMLRNGQRRTLTDNEGLPDCLPRLGVPLRRLERALDRAEGPGAWTRDRWPAAPQAKREKASRDGRARR
jgi:hypothetical protein